MRAQDDSRFEHGGPHEWGLADAAYAVNELPQPQLRVACGF